MRLNVLIDGPALKGALVALAVGGLAAASCTFNPGAAGSKAEGATGAGFAGSILGGGGSPGNPGAGGSSSSTGVAASGGPSADGPNCGLQHYGLDNVPPDLLIVQDKSGSMDNQADDTPCMGGAACTTKWTDMTAAINMVVAQTDTTIRWGLKYFPSNRSCGVNAGAAVPIAAGNAMAIATSIRGTNPGGSTPTSLGVSTGAAYLQTLTDPNPKYILLATDGLPNCAPGKANDADDTAGAVQAVTDAAAAGIPVFVVGVGNVAMAQSTLDMMAVAGGRPQAGTPKYYPVSRTADLVSVLTKIGGQITSCSFGLGKAPPDPSNIGVYANPGMMKIARDPTHANGWDYGAGMTSIVLFGPACDNVKNKATSDVQAIFGCPGQVIP